MSKIYLHKKNNYEFSTTKDEIILDIEKVDKNYKFVSNILKKYPKTLEIIGDKYVTFLRTTYLFDFPVEKVIINIDYFVSFSNHLSNFYNTRNLELSNKAYDIDIHDNLGLNKIKNITIPFTIKKFINKNIKNNNITTLTIFSNEDFYTIELDECLLNKEISIKALNNDNILNINITSDNIDIEYKVFLENNKLISTKKYNKFEINANNDKREELNLIELKKLYNDITFTGKYYYVRKITLDKNDIHLLTQDIFNNLNLEEINIIDNNDMSLLPRNISIKVNRKKYEMFDKIETIYNSLLISYAISPDKILLINDNIKIIYIDKYIKTTILDYNANIIKYENYTLTIPFNKTLNNITSSEILNEIIRYSDEIIVKRKNNNYKIELTGLSDIIYQSNDSFKVEYLREIYGKKYHKVIENYDFTNNKITREYIGDYIEEKVLLKTKRPIKRW